jgi:hypothetical protein
METLRVGELVVVGSFVVFTRTSVFSMLDVRVGVRMGVAEAALATGTWFVGVAAIGETHAAMKPTRIRL